MYREHQPIIADYAQRNPENMVNTIEFVMATIQTNFSKVPQKLVTKRGFNTSQQRSLAYLWQGRHAVYSSVMARIGNDVELMRYLTNIEGLGIPKAGFTAQLVAGVAGCIDVHNATLYGVNLRRFSLNSTTSYASRTNKIVEYLALCSEKLGGSEVLWDKWCDHLGHAWEWCEKKRLVFYPWRTAEEVSAFHVTACCR